MRPGDTVLVRGGFGREMPERVTILDVGIEAGRKVIDYIDHRGRTRWAYAEQVTELREAS